MDTALFSGGSENRSLKANFAACLERLEKRMNGFVCQTELQRARGRLQAQAVQNAERDGEIYLMHMPTGSGKTLCSMQVALRRALRENSGKKRIIYIIPYNSIIEQTAEVFADIFGEDMEILRHQSTFSYEDADMEEQEKQTAKLACENWDAQVIITTAVQFFESIYSNRRSRLRKLHNMADSILIFDEAHLMPDGFLQPCLEAIVYLTRYLNSEAVFLTATMPDFRELLQRYTLPDSRVIDLITDTSAFGNFAKCSFADGGVLSQESLLQRAMEMPSALIVVNQKRTARALYEKCSGGKYHLSTYMTAIDRKAAIAEIKEALAALEEAYPDLRNVPPERRITVISTSLIEAGVDLDFSAVYRELAGLDSILQAGGRCNREGKRPKAFSVIDDKNISLVVPQDAESRALIADCQRGFPNSRRLQKYTCSVSRADLEELQPGIPLSAETADQAELCKGAAAGRKNRKGHSGYGKKCGAESKGRLQGNFPLHQAP